MKQMIILYNIKENMVLVNKEKIFLKICNELGIEAKKVNKNDCKKSITSLLKVSNIESDNIDKNIDKTDLPEILIFNGLDNEMLDKFLDRYNEYKLTPIGLKAVVTPVNMMWTLDNLIDALIKERSEHEKK